MSDTAETKPEIVDWARLAEVMAPRLRAVAGLASDPDDLTAAVARLIARVLQPSRMPDASAWPCCFSSCGAVTTGRGG